MRNIKSKIDVHGHIYGLRVNSYNRFETFLEIEKLLNNDLYAYALITAFDSSDNTYMWRKKVKESFIKVNAHHSSIMNKKELETLESLPETLTIYRGMTIKEKDSGDYGVAWTLDKKVAEFFAFHYERNHSAHHLEKTVHSLRVAKKDIIAYCNERNEKTIFYVHHRRKLLLKMERKIIHKRLKDSQKFSISIKNHSNSYGNRGHKDKLYVNSIKPIMKKTEHQDSFHIDLDFCIRKRLSLDYFAKDIETDFYEKLDSMLKGTLPKKVRDFLKKIVGLPSGSRLLKKYVLNERRRLVNPSIHSEYIYIVYSFHIAIPFS